MEELDKSQHAPSATATTAAVPEMHTPSSTHTMRYVDHDTLTDSRGLSLLHTPPASQPSSQGNSQLIHHYQPALTLKATPQQDSDSSSPPAPAAVQVNTTNTKPRTSAASSGTSSHSTRQTHSGSTSPMIDTKLHNNENEKEKKRMADSLDSVNEDSLDDTPPRVAATRTNRTQHIQASHETLDVHNKESCEGTNTMACLSIQTTTTPFVESSDDGEESPVIDKSDEHITQEEAVVQPRSPEPREGSSTTVLTSHTLTPHTTRTTTTAAASTTHLCLSETLLPQSHPQTPSPMRKSREQTIHLISEHEKKEEECPLRRELLFIDNADGTAYLADAALQGDGSYTLGQTILLAQRPDSMLQHNHKSNTVGQKHAYDMSASPLPRAPCTESLSRALNMDAEEDMVPLTQLRATGNESAAQGDFTEADASPLAIRPPWASTSSFSPSVSLMHVARVVRPTNTNNDSERSAAPARSDTEYPATPLFLSSTTLDVQTTLKKKEKEKETPIEEEEDTHKMLQETGPRRERAVSRRSNSPAALHDFAFDQTILLCPVVPTNNSNSYAPSINVPMSAQFQHYNNNKATREECPSPAIVVVPPGGALPQSDVHRTNNTACENDKSLLQADQTAVFTDSEHANNNNFDEVNADVTLLMNSFADSVRILPPNTQPFMSGSNALAPTTTTAGADTLNNDNNMTRVPRTALRPTALTPQQIAAQGWIPVQVYNPHTMPDFAPSAEDILHATSMPSAGRHAASPLPLDPLTHNNNNIIDETTTEQYDMNFSPLPTCTTPHHTSVTSADQGWREGSPSRPNSRSLVHQYNNRRRGSNISAGAAIRTATPLDATTLATISRRLSFSTQSGWGSPTLTNASMTLSRQGSFIDPSTAVGSPYGLQSHNGSFSMSRATSLYGSPATALAACGGPMNAHHSASDWAGQTVMQWQTQSQRNNIEKIPLYVDARRQVDTASPLPLNPQSPSPEPREGSPSRCTTESNTPVSQTVMREAGKTATQSEAEKHVTTRTEETQTDITTGEENTLHETPRETQSAMSDASSRALQWSDLLTSMSFQRSVALTATLMEYSSALTGTSLSLPLTTTSQPSSASASLQLHRPTTRLSDMQYFFKPHNNNNNNTVTNITTTTTTTTTTTKVTMPRQAAPGRGSVGDVTSYASSILSSVTTQSEQLPRTGGAIQRAAAGQDRTTTTGVTSGTNFACKRPPALRRMRGLPITRGSLHASLHGGLAENGTSRGHRGIHDMTRNSTRLQTAYVDPMHMPATANISNKQGPMASDTTQYNKQQQGPMHVTSHASVAAAKLVPDTSVFLPFSPLTITPESSYNMPSNPVCEDNNKEEATTITTETRQSNNAQDTICRVLPLEVVTNAESTNDEDNQRDVDERITVKSQPAALHIVSQPQLPVTPSDMELDMTLSSTLNNRLTMAGVSPIGRPSVCLPALRERTSANIDECNLSKAAAERHSSTHLGLNSTPHDVTI